VRRLLAESESYQSEIRKMTAERMKQSQYASGQYASKIKDLEEQLGYFRDLQSDKKMRVGELEEKVGKAKRLTQKLTTENDALKLKIKNIENRYEESIKKYQS
jgi:chromosome segregation ATPase